MKTKTLSILSWNTAMMEISIKKYSSRSRIISCLMKNIFGRCSDK